MTYTVGVNAGREGDDGKVLPHGDEEREKREREKREKSCKRVEDNVDRRMSWLVDEFVKRKERDGRKMI